jgi:hypothetical protein
MGSSFQEHGLNGIVKGLGQDWDMVCHEALRNAIVLG